MNLIDKAIGWVSPRTALARVQARYALNSIVGQVRKYDGAARGRRTQNWLTGGTSANAEISIGGALLRARARDLMRNDPYARKAILSLVANAVGTGITCDSVDRVGKLWKAWVKECDFYGELDFHGIQALAARCAFEAGEVLVVRQRLGSSEVGRSGVPLQIKVLEPDYLDTNKHGQKIGNNTIIDGIEVDQAGRVVAYHLYSQHPGDAPLFSPKLTSIRYPAADVIHLFEKERPGQLRGVTRLAPVMLQLRDLDEFNEALLVKKKVESCFGVIITTSDRAQRLGQTESRDGREIETLSPGMIKYLDETERVDFANPSNSDVGDFEAACLRAAAAGIGTMYELISGDLSRVNFSSIRAGRQEFKLMIEQYRWLTFIPMFCERVWGWFEEAAYQAGKLRATGYEHIWTPPRWEYVQPLQDVQTDREELDSGLSSWAAQIRKRGDDPDQVLADIEKYRDRLLALGVNFSSKGTASPVGADPPPANPTDPPANADSIDEPTNDAKPAAD